MFRKKSIQAVALGSLVALAVAGCAATDGGDAAPVDSIKVVAAEYSPETSGLWADIAERFTAETGIKVDMQVISWNDIHQQVSTMIQTNQLPDILNIDSFSQYAAEDLLWETKDVFSDRLAGNLADNLASSGEFDGKEYGIPFVGSASVLFYNPDLFAQAGIDGPPTTFEELMEDAIALSALPDTVGFGLSLSPEAPHVDFSQFLFSNGGDYVVDGEWTINSDKNVETLSFLNDLTAAGGTEINPGKTGRQDGTWQLFEAGTAGMVIGQSALADRLAQTDTPYETVIFPSAPGVEPTSLGIADYLMAFKKPGNQDAVTQFLDFALAQENYQPFIEEEGFIPVTTDVQEALSSDPAFGAYIEAITSARFLPVGEAAWPTVLGQMKNSLGLAVQGDDPRKILDDIQATAKG